MLVLTAAVVHHHRGHLLQGRMRLMRQTHRPLTTSRGRRAMYLSRYHALLLKQITTKINKMQKDLLNLKVIYFDYILAIIIIFN